jgi:nucleoside-diphosphate-sugar epimerase
MRVIVIGGTHFIGRALLAELVAHGHEVLAVHRGIAEPAGLPDVAHLHANRRELDGVRDELAAFRAGAVIDMSAMTGPDTEAALAALPRGPRLVVASSQDVYRAFASLLAGQESDPVPLDEDAALRETPIGGRERPADSPWDFDEAQYEKLDVERAYLARGGTAVRLPFTYGEHDNQRREESILGRLRAGRARIPVGTGGLLWSKGYVADMAAGLRLAAEAPEAAGQVFNLSEKVTVSMARWCQRIIDVAGAAGRAELVTVPDDQLPPDLRLTGAFRQHILVDSGRARRELGWTDTDPDEALARSVAWHQANPPDDRDQAPDRWAADDAALASATG